MAEFRKNTRGVPKVMKTLPLLRPSLDEQILRYRGWWNERIKEGHPLTKRAREEWAKEGVDWWTGDNTSWPRYVTMEALRVDFTSNNDFDFHSSTFGRVFKWGAQHDNLGYKYQPVRAAEGLDSTSRKTCAMFNRKPSILPL